MADRRKERKPLIMMQDDVKADKTNQKIKRRVMDRECCINWMPRTCFKQNTNDDDDCKDKILS